MIAGNWKSYVTSTKEAKKLFKDIEKGLPRQLKADVVLFPPSLLLHPLARNYSGKRISFGAQDIFFESGAHTGETPALLAKDVGARYALIGHAEKRAQGETDETVAKKVGAALDAKLTPVVAFGESSRDKNGEYLEDLARSILESLALVDVLSLKKVILAYEPVWAIGAPLPPTGRTIRHTMIFIRKTLAQKFKREDALKVRILYGGAVNEESALEIIQNGETGGFLLGRASIHADSFTSIVSQWATK